MKAFIAVKFHGDAKNRKLIEQISSALEKAGHDTIVIFRDHEEWGAKVFRPEELMDRTLDELEGSDFLVVELSEKGVGIGIEAGYARARGKPIFVVAKNGSDISETLKGIATEVFFYEEPDELTGRFRDLKV